MQKKPPPSAAPVAPAAPSAAATAPAESPAALVGVPVSAIEEFAHNLHAAGVDGSQIAVFGTAPALDTDRVAIRFARALARDARVVLVALGSGDAAIREISTDPDAPGLASLAAGQASFGAIITRDIASNLNLIAAGRNSSRGSLLAAPGIMGTFDALAHAYPHLVIDGGLLGGGDGMRDIAAIARVATHALLVVETAAGYATAQARDSLLEFRLRQCHHPDRRPRRPRRRHRAQSLLPDPRRRGVAFSHPPPRSATKRGRMSLSHLSPRAGRGSISRSPRQTCRRNSCRIAAS